MANYDIELNVTPGTQAEVEMAVQVGSEVSESNAEAWAVGKRHGVDVPDTDPTYHNNSKYYAQQADEDAQTASGAKDDAIDAKADAEAARDAAQSAVAHYPYVDPTTGNWMCWDTTTGTWVNTGVHAQGPTGAVPNIQIGTVTKLSPGSTPTVTRRSGSPDTAPVFDFGLVTGDTGSAANVYGTTVPMSEQDSTKVKDAIDGKASKVSGATSGNFAALDSNGNLTDSGKKASDFVTDVSGKADKVANATENNFAALDSNGNLKDSGKKASDFVTDVSGKADKVASATENDFAGLDSNGNLKDSGKKASDFAAASHTHSGYAEKVSGATSGNFAGLDSNGNLTDSGKKASDFVTDVSGKADKVTSPTENDFAALDSNGNLKDSGKKASDFAEAAAGLPTGGTQAQFLMKTSGTNYAASWVSPDTVPGTNTNNVITSGAVKTVKDSADLALSSIADVYDPTKTYKEGNLIFYEISGTTYLMRCKGTTTGSFDPTKWEQKDIGYAIQKVQENVDGLIDDTAGDGDTNKAWSADKITDELGDRDTAIGNVAAGLAIVVTGDTAPANIDSGEYIFLKGHSSLPTGGYHATAAISSGDTISSSNVAADADGIANALNSKIETKTAITFTNLSSGWSVSENHSYRIGNVVYVNVMVSRSSTGSLQKIMEFGNAPAGIMPTTSHMIGCVNYTNDAPVAAYINTAGAFNVFGCATTCKALLFSGSYVVE